MTTNSLVLDPQCVDYDECNERGMCGPNARCRNTVGGHECSCDAGFVGDPYSRTGCIDVNECTKEPCGAGALCKNTPGNYTCQCPSGFRGDPLVQCQGESLARPADPAPRSLPRSTAINQPSAERP